MMDGPFIEVVRVLDAVPAGAIAPSDAEAILEIGYLSIAADGELRDEELASYRALAAELIARAKGATPRRGAELTDPALDALLRRFAARSDASSPEERVRALAEKLTGEPARSLAYKIAFGLALCDFDAGREESDFDDLLVEALGLTEQQAEDLAAEVYTAVEGDDDDEEEDEDEDDDDEEDEEEEEGESEDDGAVGDDEAR
jgi:hypothetical protein